MYLHRPYKQFSTTKVLPPEMVPISGLAQGLKVLGCIFHVYGEEKPQTDWAQISFGGRCPRHYHVVQIWWRSVEGFRVSWGSKFALSHWLWWSSLQQSLKVALVHVVDSHRTMSRVRVAVESFAAGLSNGNLTRECVPVTYTAAYISAFNEHFQCHSLTRLLHPDPIID